MSDLSDRSGERFFLARETTAKSRKTKRSTSNEFASSPRQKKDGISPSIVPISTVKDDKMLGLILVTSARSRDLKIRTASGPLSDLENKPLRLVHTKCQEFVLHALSILSYQLPMLRFRNCLPQRLVGPQAFATGCIHLHEVHGPIHAALHLRGIHVHSELTVLQLKPEQTSNESRRFCSGWDLFRNRAKHESGWVCRCLSHSGKDLRIPEGNFKHI